MVQSAPPQYQEASHLHFAPTIDSKQYNLSIDQKFLGIDDIYILDMQEELSKADNKMPLVNFLANMELKVAKVIAGKKPGRRKSTANN